MNKLFLLISLSLLGVLFCSATKTIETTNTAINSPLQGDDSVNAQWEKDHPQLLSYIETNDIEAQWLNSGLYYVIDNEGTGDRATETSTVKVRYSISILNGRGLWSTYDTGLAEEHALPSVIRAWREGIPLIKEGGTIQLIIPSGLGYGPKGLPGKIPGNTNLLCTIELVEVM